MNELPLMVTAITNILLFGNYRKNTLHYTYNDSSSSEYTGSSCSIVKIAAQVLDN